jgi:hypothetical protein
MPVSLLLRHAGRFVENKQGDGAERKTNGRAPNSRACPRRGAPTTLTRPVVARDRVTRHRHGRHSIYTQFTSNKPHLLARRSRPAAARSWQTGKDQPEHGRRGPAYCGGARVQRGSLLCCHRPAESRASQSHRQISKKILGWDAGVGIAWGWGDGKWNTNEPIHPRRGLPYANNRRSLTQVAAPSGSDLQEPLDNGFYHEILKKNT